MSTPTHSPIRTPDDIPHQPLSDLSPMADAVLRAVCVRLEREGRLDELEGEELVERPPLIRTAPPPQRSRR